MTFLPICPCCSEELPDNDGSAPCCEFDKDNPNLCLTHSEYHEVRIAPDGTLLAEFQKARTNAMSRMFDRDKCCGVIHSTSQFYLDLDYAFLYILKILSDRFHQEIL